MSTNPTNLSFTVVDPGLTNSIEDYMDNKPGSYDKLITKVNQVLNEKGYSLVNPETEREEEKEEEKENYTFPWTCTIIFSSIIVGLFIAIIFF